MSNWNNKHLTVAMLMAPILALMAYFGVNFMLGEEPQAAEPGNSYLLVEKPNCRYESGVCGLKNADFELTLNYEWIGVDRMLLKLASEHPLEGVLVALVEFEAEEEHPVEMLPAGPDGLSWSLEMARPDPENQRLHLVASAAGAFYLGDVATRFTLFESTTN